MQEKLKKEKNEELEDWKKKQMILFNENVILLYILLLFIVKL